MKNFFHYKVEREYDMQKTVKTHIGKNVLQSIEEHFKLNALESAKSRINIAKYPNMEGEYDKMILMVKILKRTKIRANSEKMPFMKMLPLNSEILLVCLMNLIEKKNIFKCNETRIL